LRHRACATQNLQVL